MVWLAFNVRLPSVDQLHEQLDRWGSLAWLAFTLLYVVVAVTPIPVTIMAIAFRGFVSRIAVLLGLVFGTLLSWILDKANVGLVSQAADPAAAPKLPRFDLSQVGSADWFGLP